MWQCLLLLIASLLLTTWSPIRSRAAEPFAFFESRIRPVLIEHCYKCHNSAKRTDSGLALDHRKAMLRGGDTGPIIVPGKPAQSRLLTILRHEVQGFEMPKEGPRLDDRIIADFEKWIASGAPDPRDTPPSAAEVTAATSWNAVLKRRMQWWSFQPIAEPQPPKVDDPAWMENPIDRFIQINLQENQLSPSQTADAATLVRRLYFNLVGLPPKAEEAAGWTKRLAQVSGPKREVVLAKLVDQLLDSPRFGERWARHWMDWIRYAESHGSEGDPRIDNAWVYRDYLIRALNADVPYDQLIREHLAGDLLEKPRINQKLGINESVIGTAHWRMVFHGFAPTDALDEKVRFTDDQINAFSKAFLGLTVSCARCHDHKFDAISQADYYALFGILSSCRPGRQVIDLPERVNRHRAKLEALKTKIQKAIADDWLTSVEANGQRMPEKWQNQLQHYQPPSAEQKPVQHWDLSQEQDYATWFRHGAGLPKRPQAAGSFALALKGDAALTGIFPAGVYSHELTPKHPARLTSSNILLGDNLELWVHARGNGSSTLRYVVQDYPRDGTVYPVKNLSKEWRWQRFDLSYWSGDTIHIELTTAKDAPLLVKDQPRSWFGVRQVMILPKGERPPAEHLELLAPLANAAKANPATSPEEATDLFQSVIITTIKRWRDRSLTDAQALLLDACLQEGLLPNQLEALPTAAPLIRNYRRLEADVPVPTRVPALDETVGHDHPLFIRGDHHKPGDTVPRRFLEAIDPTPYKTRLSGRLELAEDLLRDDNPFTRRVIVNRVWHHLFGRGIVATPDNFGRLGAKPTHPELLDWLANQFVADGWSLKELIRQIVLSQTWQRSSIPSVAARERDPDNQLWSHAEVRRLEAEAIRDALLTVSGRLEHRLSGPPVDGDMPRRSIYVRVIRNNLDPFLRSFDFPEPFSTVGRRDVTNVPAQSLTLLNDPRVADYAAGWASWVLEDPSLKSTTERIRAMFLIGFGRPATPTEVIRTSRYLSDTRQRQRAQRQQIAELEAQLVQQRKNLNKLLAPARRRLMAATKQASPTPDRFAPEPIARWDFAAGLTDSIGQADGTLQGSALVKNGALVVHNRGYVLTKPLQQTLKAKTLEAWVQLDTLDQRGGGVISVQTPDGNVFDAIVFGEQEPGRWMPGSNFFKRTESFEGQPETVAADRPVHIAIAYHADGRIVGYRDGKPYGKAYHSAGPHTFPAGQAVVGFGIRHLPAGGNRMLRGRILKAQLYDRALSPDEVATSAAAAPKVISEKQILAELTLEQRQRVAHRRRELQRCKDKLSALGPPSPANAQAVWAELARALFTFKEFIYVR